MFTCVFIGLGPASCCLTPPKPFILTDSQVFGWFRLMTVNEEVGSGVKLWAAALPRPRRGVQSEDKGPKSESRRIRTCGSFFFFFPLNQMCRRWLNLRPFLSRLAAEVRDRRILINCLSPATWQESNVLKEQIQTIIKRWDNGKLMRKWSWVGGGGICQSRLEGNWKKGRCRFMPYLSAVAAGHFGIGQNGCTSKVRTVEEGSGRLEEVVNLQDLRPRHVLRLSSMS